MNESLKKSSKTLYSVCACIIVLMVICYFGVINSKGTYALDPGSGNCPSNATNCTVLSDGISCIAYFSSASACGGGCNNDGEGTYYRTISNCVVSTQTCCESKGLYETKSSCENIVNKKCKVASGSVCGGNCYVPTSVGLNCNYETQSSCENAVGEVCEFNEGFGCWLPTGEELNRCSSSYYDKFYANGETQCEKETGYDCSCSGGCCNVSSTLLGGTGAACTNPGGFSGTCGDNSIDVCQIGGTFSCTINSSSYSYSCVHDSGSQTDGNYSWSTCTLVASNKCYKCNSDVDDYTYIWKSQQGASCWEVSGVTTQSDCEALNDSSNPNPYEKCYNCDGTYVWKSLQGSCILASKYTTSASCSAANSSGLPGDDTTSGGGSTPTNPDNPSNPSGGNGDNITENPKTGSVAIFMVWIIAIGTLVYSFVYFKQSKFEG